MKIIVMAVEERMETVKELQAVIPDLIVVKDKVRSATETFLRKMHIIGASSALHLEDDIILADNFLERVNNEIRKRPNEVIQFFSMRKADLEIGSRYDNKFLGALCYYTPPFFCISFLNWFYSKFKDYKDVDEQWSKDCIDYIVQKFLQHQKQKYWIVVPNLVDHKIGKSAIDPRRGSTNRVSKTFVK